MERRAVIAGAVFAGAGVLIAVWRLWPHVAGGANAPPDPAVAAAQQQLDAARRNDDPTRYAAPSDTADVRRLFDESAPHLERAAASSIAGPGLSPGSAERFSDAARLALEPMLSGDFDAYVAAVRALGGVLPESPGELEALREDFTTGSRLIALAPFDTDAVEVRSYAVDGVKREMRADISWMVASGLVGVRQSTNPDRYPDATAYARRKLDAWEAMVPIQLRTAGGDGPGILSVALAWDPEAGRWTPIEYRVYYSVDTDLANLVM